MTDYQDILKKFEEIDPIAYGKSRNFIDGRVTNLSPYVSRGVIDAPQLLDHLVKKGYSYFQLEKFIQQLAWREYFQRVWQMMGDQINTDIKQEQGARISKGIPLALQDANTGIDAIDDGIRQLKSSGSMHNHLRMYTAFLACNLAGFHWHDPAKWMYYHLLDGDWASNALSWQWVAGTFSSKKYIANQENINHYTKTFQRGSYLDRSYDELGVLDAPTILHEEYMLQLKTKLPESVPLNIDPDLPVLVYNYYNLSPTWRKDERANRILLLEPTIFEQYPVSGKCLDFMLQLSKNVEGIKIYVGSFDSLKQGSANAPIYYREHPLNKHYVGHEDQRNWMTDGQQPSGSFFSFWKKAEKGIKKKYFS